MSIIERIRRWFGPSAMEQAQLRDEEWTRLSEKNIIEEEAGFVESKDPNKQT